MQSFNFTGSLPTFSSIFSFLPLTSRYLFQNISLFKISGKTNLNLKTNLEDHGGLKIRLQNRYMSTQILNGFNFIFTQTSGNHCPPKQAKCPLLVVLVLSENPTCKTTSKKITTAKKLALRVCPNQEKFSFPSDCFVY